MNLGLSDLLKIKGAEVVNGKVIEKIKFSGVLTDSRKCGSNDLFFAIKGEKFDGHNFVEDVLRSAKCAVVNKQWYKRLSSSKKRSFKNKALVLTDDTVKALGSLANIYRRKFIIPVLAIAGSNGKTSTKDFIAHVLSKKYRVLKTEGNLNNAIGVPLTLFRLSARHEIAVIETGTNHFGEIEYLCKILMPQFGLVTNIGKEHLEFLKNIKGAAKAEGELIQYLKQIHGTYFLNQDDRYLVKQADKKEMKVFSYGVKKGTDVNGKIKRFNKFYPETEIKYRSKIINTGLNTIGYQSFSSALSAAAVGFYFEVPAHKIKKAISEYKIESGKRNQLRNINGIWVIDDTYNSNPDSVIAALENLKAYKISGKKYLVLSDMLELGISSRKEHREIGKAVKNMKFDNLYTYGRDSYQTHLGAKGMKNNYHFIEKETLAEFLKLNIKRGDAVLVKGSRGMKMEDVIESLNKASLKKYKR
jgi:UDP-N-acetylmuramoyl-tripeptide--D-alanyl-D-alanine ligase